VTDIELRDKLALTIASKTGLRPSTIAMYRPAADAILAEFEVTEKPPRYYAAMDSHGNRCVCDREGDCAPDPSLVIVPGDTAFSRALASEIAHFMNERGI
jgi:hypothetical protein